MAEINKIKKTEEKTEKNKKSDMLKGSPGKSLLIFALPLILGNLFQQFYNIVDSVVVGKFVSEEALASVGASYSITNVFIAVAIGGGVGSAVIISQFLGAGKPGRMKTAISTTLFNFLLISLLLGFAGLIGNDWILHLLKVPDNVFKDAADYLRIYFLGLPFLFMYNVQASIFNSLGDSKTSLYLLIFSSILNILLDLLFVVEFGMGVKGVAFATLIAQGLSAVLSFIILMKKLKKYTHERTEFHLYDIQMMRSMTRVAIPSILQQSIVHMGILLVQSVVNTFGSAVMAGYSAGTRIESLAIVPMTAMGNAMSTFTAQNMGAGNVKRVKEGYRVCYVYLGCFAVILCVSIQIFGHSFVSAFLDVDASREAFETGMNYTDFISFFFILIGLKMTTDGLLRGSGDVTAFTIANLANLSIRVFVANYFAPRYGVQFVWFAVPIGWAVNYLISFIWYLTGHWSRIRLVEGNAKKQQSSPG